MQNNNNQEKEEVIAMAGLKERMALYQKSTKKKDYSTLRKEKNDAPQTVGKLDEKKKNVKGFSSPHRKKDKLKIQVKEGIFKSSLGLEDVDLDKNDLDEAGKELDGSFNKRLDGSFSNQGEQADENGISGGGRQRRAAPRVFSLGTRPTLSRGYSFEDVNNSNEKPQAVKDREEELAKDTLNGLLQRELQDSKAVGSYSGIRVRYLSAVGRLRPSDYDATNSVMELDDRKLVRSRLAEKRKTEATRKHRYDELKGAWEDYEEVCQEKPRLEDMTEQDRQLEQDLNDVEEDIADAWQEYTEDVLRVAEEQAEEAAEEGDSVASEDSDMEQWREEARRLKADAEARRLRREAHALKREALDARRQRRAQKAAKKKAAKEGEQASASPAAEDKDEPEPTAEHAGQDQHDAEDDDDDDSADDEELRRMEQAALDLMKEAQVYRAQARQRPGRDWGAETFDNDDAEEVDPDEEKKDDAPPFTEVETRRPSKVQYNYASEDEAVIEVTEDEASAPFPSLEDELGDVGDMDDGDDVSSMGDDDALDPTAKQEPHHDSDEDEEEKEAVRQGSDHGKKKKKQYFDYDNNDDDGEEESEEDDDESSSKRRRKKGRRGKQKKGVPSEIAVEVEDDDEDDESSSRRRKKKKKGRRKRRDEDSDDDDSEDDSDDSDRRGSSRRQKGKSSKRRGKNDEDSESDSDDEPRSRKKDRSNRRGKGDDSDSDSEELSRRKKDRRRTKYHDDESESESEARGSKKKNRRKQRHLEEGDDSESESDNHGTSKSKNTKGRSQRRYLDDDSESESDGGAGGRQSSGKGKNKSSRFQQDSDEEPEESSTKKKKKKKKKNNEQLRFDTLPSHNLDGTEWVNPFKSWSHKPKKVKEQAARIMVKVPEKTDCWRKTRHNFIMDNAPFFWHKIGGDFEVMVRVSGTFGKMYDKAGLMVRHDEENWIISGMEFFNNQLNHSTCVTRDFTDWSLSPLPDTEEVRNDGVWFCIKRMGDAYESFYSLTGKKWIQTRQGIFNDAPTVKVGIFCACPMGESYKVNFDMYRCKNIV